MRYINGSTFFFVLCLARFCGALLQNERYQVHIGYRVNNVDEALTVRSASVCAAECTSRNAVTPNTCMTSTYNTVTKECLLSSQLLSSATSGLGTAYKTMATVADCTKPPPVNNGVLVVTSESSTGSIATLTCNTGYIPGASSPTTAECSNVIGWLIDGISCIFPPETTYYGTSFIFGYMANGKTNSGSPTFYVMCPQGEAIVRISIPSLTIDEEVSTVGGVLTKQYTSTLASASSGSISLKAVVVTTNTPVVMFSGNLKTGSSDGSFILPESSLQSTYMISSHPSTGSGLGEFLVVGTSDTTQVTLTTSTGLSETIALNRMQTFYKKASDLTGTMISASAPLFVLSGHECANIPDNAVKYCDYIEAAMPPINALGTVHIMSFMKPRPDFTVSIVAPFNQTAVTITDKVGTQIDFFSLNERNSAFRTYTGSAIISIITDLPVLVTLYGHGSTLVLGDPSMMIVSDITFFGHVYDFFVPTGFNEPSTLQIIISEVYQVSGLLLNGVPLSPSETIATTVPQHGTFIVVYADVVSDKYRITHTSGNAVSFGAWLYGRTNNQEYATNLGINA